MANNDLVEADDGLPAEKVGSWVKEKHEYLRRYVDISRATRQKYLGAGKAGATFVDLFSACGRAKIKGGNVFVEGSPLVAWHASSDGRAAFSNVFIADRDDARRDACAQRLEAARAPVVAIVGDAVTAADTYAATVNKAGLHFAFLDPHSLGALDFRIIKSLASLQRMDMLIHVSAMDLQRNLDRQLSDSELDDFDRFAPGWRSAVGTQSAKAVRATILDHWKRLVSGLDGYSVHSLAHPVKGEEGQRLYWLMFAARHSLAHKFWSAIGRVDGQKQMEF